MSELLGKILCNEITVEEVIWWLSANHVKVLKCGTNQLDFSRFLIEFLREHTCQLLPVPEPQNAETPNTTKTETPNASSNDKYPLLVKSADSSFASPFSEKSFPSLKSPSSCINSPGEDRFKSTTKTPVQSPFTERSFNTPRSDDKRSPNNVKLNNTPSPKPLQLGDFLVIKRKTPKIKVKKHIQPISPATENNTESAVDDNVAVRDAKNQVSETNKAKIKPEHEALIEKLALLYSATISSNLVQDLLKELNYVMSLLTNNSEFDSNVTCCCSKTEIPLMFTSNAKEICLFKRYYEGIYFACVVLENQWSLLKYLNKATLTIISENDSIRAYSPHLSQKIISFMNENKLDSRNVNVLNREILGDTVKFMFDTDSRPNYVNNESFYAFKKQRDEFYGLLHEWEESCQQQPSAEFFKAKYKRLRSIFTISSAITNMSRLADLFVSQILASVFNENSETGEGTPMTKFDLLTRRFVMPCSIVVGNEKRFPGVQEFFKDFLRSAENSFFYTHVQNALVHRIISLDNFEFSCEVSVNLQKQELFLNCINKLCLLAKFLSLITFLPYQDEYELPLHFRLPLTEVRKEIQPPLDLNGCLMESMKKGRMILTIPWIVEFLNGIDTTSILLPYYKTIFAKLQYLLYKLKLPLSETLVHEGISLLYSEDAKDDKNKKELRTVRATEISSLVKEKRLEISERFVGECLRTINCSQILITLYVNSLFNNVPISTIITSEDISTIEEKPVLISSEFYIDETALYQCCPQLYELKNLLEGGKRLSYKSVIPKMEKTFCEQESDPKAVDVLLEMHLFDNMPKCVKNSVEFVAERIASLCVKSIRQEMIPSLKNEINNELQKLRDEKRVYKEEAIMDHMMAKFYSILRSGVKKELSKFYPNIEMSVKALIETEVADEQVINICIDISCRKCIEIVYNWIFNYINVDEIIRKNESIKAELARLKMTEAQLANEKKSKKSKSDVQRAEFQEWMSKERGQLKENSSEISTTVQVLHILRNLVRTVLSNYYDLPVTFEEVDDALKECYNCIKYSPDLQFVSFRRMMMLTIELCQLLVFFNPEIITTELLTKFKSVWELQKVCSLRLPFEHVLSYRNMDYFCSFYMDKSQCVCIRNAIREFLIFTINHEFLSVKKLLSQVLRLGRHEWPNEILTHLSTCLSQVMDQVQKGQEKIKSAIQWIAEFLHEDDWM
ncbi:codanin-1 [Planococcus citri]|uniref:codanin-1 n=1 Tax=Planococcus citri TaxID=170843 RepID=UPI0031F75C70